MSDAQPNTVHLTQMTRQQRAALPLSTDVAQAGEGSPVADGAMP
jgi:hypothetical protein